MFAENPGLNRSSHHHAGRDGYPTAAIGVWHDVAVADAEEGDGDQPHGVQQVGVLLVVIPATDKDKLSGTW